MGQWEVGSGAFIMVTLGPRPSRGFILAHAPTFPQAMEGNGAMVSWLLNLPLITETHDSYGHISLAKAGQGQA